MFRGLITHSEDFPFPRAIHLGPELAGATRELLSTFFEDKLYDATVAFLELQQAIANLWSRLADCKAGTADGRKRSVQAAAAKASKRGHLSTLRTDEKEYSALFGGNATGAPFSENWETAKSGQATKHYALAREFLQRILPYLAAAHLRESRGLDHKSDQLDAHVLEEAVEVLKRILHLEETQKQTDVSGQCHAEDKKGRQKGAKPGSESQIRLISTENAGNTCYLGSCLQMVLPPLPVATHLRNASARGLPSGANKDAFKLYRDILYAYTNGIQKNIGMKRVNRMRELLGFAEGAQQDAHKCYVQLTLALGVGEGTGKLVHITNWKTTDGPSQFGTEVIVDPFLQFGVSAKTGKAVKLTTLIKEHQFPLIKKRPGFLTKEDKGHEYKETIDVETGTVTKYYGQAESQSSLLVFPEHFVTFIKRATGVPVQGQGRVLFDDHLDLSQFQSAASPL
uniref:Uncharacterized protein n=1 Tax=Chromera velia CCMP2878 TaxID=1169474 RepID=A0A0G4FTC8_9ALVE|eukprot:Cvel_18531.t1-p1 / transcript=Cvel_18531.t1 / gene=Cvel_18531 / organism=Chromera_velia_CCMP2878 / gene_product=hypothetical protein / transcript_product=hypothetical protein / location=Cvel_scaffold1541:17506-19160(+) / protein_length=453 / sequence_SO=supercontig / SO=protein_coding / is_pseudo=false